MTLLAVTALACSPRDGETPERDRLGDDPRQASSSTSTEDGTDTDTSIPCVVAEDDGPTCSDGIDNDCNGVFDCEEESCRQILPTRIQGMLTVTTPASVVGLHCVQEITGDLYAHMSSLTTMSMPLLHTVEGMVYFHETQLATLELPVLERVGDGLYMHGNSGLVTLDLGSVSEVVREVYLNDLGAVSALGMVSLASVGEYVYVADSAQLQSLDMTALATVNVSGERDADYVYIGSNPLISECETDLLLAQLQLNGFAGDFDVVGAASCP